MNTLIGTLILIGIIIWVWNRRPNKPVYTGKESTVINPQHMRYSVIVRWGDLVIARGTVNTVTEYKSWIVARYPLRKSPVKERIYHSGNRQHTIVFKDGKRLVATLEYNR